MNEQERLDLLVCWHNAKQAADNVKHLLEEERELRKKVQDAFFSEPKEGTNSAQLPTGWKLKMVYKIDRKVDTAKLEQLMTQASVDDAPLIEDLLSYKPSLITSAYRSFLDYAPAQLVADFNEVLIARASVASMIITPPKGLKQ